MPWTRFEQDIPIFYRSASYLMEHKLLHCFWFQKVQCLIKRQLLAAILWRRWKNFMITFSHNNFERKSNSAIGFNCFSCVSFFSNKLLSSKSSKYSNFVVTKSLFQECENVFYFVWWWAVNSDCYLLEVLSHNFEVVLSQI